MELILNLLWVLIALATFVWWRRRAITPHRSVRRKWAKSLEIAALICALAVLFPTISVTDDLYAALAVMDDFGASRRSGVSAHDHHAPSAHNGPSSFPGRISSVPATFALSVMPWRTTRVDPSVAQGPLFPNLTYRGPPEFQS